MPQNTPSPEGETRPNISRLELARNRVGKGVEPMTPEPQPTPPESPPVEPQPIQKVQPVTPPLPLVATPYPQQGLGQPSMHDRRSEVPFDARYKKENFMIDKRLLPHVYAWIKRNGMSKVDAVNRAWLKILLADGYPIDPNVLDRPFQWEDLPK